MNTTLKDLIAGTHELASLPQTSARLLELLEDPTVEAVQLLDVIGRDPGLTANLLKLCNSAYYGRRREVGSLLEALVMLGNRTVLTLAFATSMGKVLRGELAGYGLRGDDLWRHCLAVAFGAATIVRDEGRENLRDRAFTAGLVHDIGKLLLDRLLARRLEWEASPQGEREQLDVERQVVGFDHAEAGAALADAWRFPEQLVTAIRWHHEPEAAGGDVSLVAAVHAADLIAVGVGYSGVGGRAAAQTAGDLVEVPGVAAEIVRHVCAQLPAEVERLAGLGPEPVGAGVAARRSRW